MINNSWSNIEDLSSLVDSTISEEFIIGSGNAKMQNNQYAYRVWSPEIGNIIYVWNKNEEYIPPVPGCTNSAANNYNADATEDDGSCIYLDELILSKDTSLLYKELLTENGIDAYILYNKYKYTSTEIRELGFDNWPEPNTNEASTSGDPHIFPLVGNMYELPQTSSIYRLLQGDDIIINASTRNITKQESKDIIEYSRNNTSNTSIESKNLHNNLVHSGVFYNKVYVSCDSMGFAFDFEKQHLTLHNKQSREYFTFNEKTLTNTSASKTIYEHSENISQLSVSFVHSIYGELELKLNYFSNPQIKYGIGMKFSDSTEGLSGLLIREYMTDSMILCSLEDETEMNGELGVNPRITNLNVV